MMSLVRHLICCRKKNKKNIDLDRHFFSVFKIYCFCFLQQKMELTADDGNTHPGELSRVTFEVQYVQLRPIQLPPIKWQTLTNWIECHFWHSELLIRTKSAVNQSAFI